MANLKKIPLMLRSIFSFAAISILSTQAVAQQVLIDETAWDKVTARTAMATVFGGAGNYTLVESYASANSDSIFSIGNKFVFMEGGADVATPLQNFITTNQSSILNWVASGKRLLIQSAGWYNQSISIGNATLTLSEGTSESSSGVLTPLGLAEFVFYPAATGTVTGNWLAHNYVTLSNGKLDVYATGTTEGAGAQPIIAGFKYGNGYIILSGLTSSNYHDPSDSNWLENLIAYLNSLKFGPSATDTLASMQGNVNSLRSLFSLQAAYANPGLSYDCPVFDKNGVCVAASGRYTNVSGNSGTEVFSGVLTGAYRVNPNIRIGGFIEQYASDINTGGVNVTNTNPDFGIFGVWSQNESGEGLRFRGAYRYGEHNIRITRDAIGDAEPGAGESNLHTQGAQFTVSNGFALNNSMLLSPYAGVRYLSISRGGYTETATATVTTPLTYGKLRQETSSALLGVNLAAKLNPALNVNGTIGVEHDISQQIGNYTATGVDGLGAINFSDDTRKTRMVASAGVTYKLDPTQQIGAQVFYREEAYGSTSTTTGMVTYSIGF